MARPKAFDEDFALDQAVELFWRQGYAATSIRDLETHLGVGRQSLYNTFGDKHALFLKALERYASNQNGMRSGLNHEDAGLAEIQAWFEGLVLFATPEGPRPACFIINTVAELGDEDVDAAKICRQNRQNLTRGFKSALEGAAERGEIRAPDDVAASADFLTSQTYGIVLLAKNGASRSRLRAVSAQAIRAIL